MEPDKKIWSLLVTPGVPILITPSQTIVISNAALASELQEPHGRSTLQLGYNDNKTTTVLCSLFGGRNEQCILNIFLTAGESYIATVIGMNHIYLTGYYIGGASTMPTRATTPAGGADGPASNQRPTKGLKRPSSEVTAPPQRNTEPQGVYSRRPPTTHAPAPIPATTAARHVDELSDHKRLAKRSKWPSSELDAPSRRTMEPQKAHDRGSPAAQAPAPTETTNKDKGKAKGLHPRVLVTESEIGTGDVAEWGCTVEVTYMMRLLDGRIIHDSRERSDSLVVGAKSVIAGWDDNIAGMHVGGRRQLIIPPEFAFGTSGSGDIGPNATIVIDFALLECRRNEPKQLKEGHLVDIRG